MYQFTSWLLCFQFGSLLMSLGGQRRVAQILGAPATPVRDPNGIREFWLRPCPDLAAMAI